jgi:hypothetical protein
MGFRCDDFGVGKKMNNPSAGRQFLRSLAQKPPYKFRAGILSSIGANLFTVTSI